MPETKAEREVMNDKALEAAALATEEWVEGALKVIYPHAQYNESLSNDFGQAFDIEKGARLITAAYLAALPIKLPELTTDQIDYLNRISKAQENIDMGTVIGGPKRQCALDARRTRDD